MNHFFLTLRDVLSKSKKSLWGACISAFEWYDYALFGYFAVTIGHEFFPIEDPFASLLASFSVFASGFLMRPLGALLFGHIGDHIGRRTALILSLILMAIPTTLLGLLPTYASIGIMAPICLVMIRLLQGLAMGGNYGGSFIFAIENAQPGNQALVGSLTALGVIGGFLIGSIIASISWNFFPDTQLAWRIPFLLGSLSALFGYIMSKKVPEEVPSEETGAPILNLFQKETLTQLLRAIGMILLDGVGIYVMFVFIIAYASRFLGIPMEACLTTNSITMGLMVLFIPFFGYLSDRYTPQIILMGTSVSFIVLAVPLFALLIAYPMPSTLFFVQTIFCIMMASVYGALPVMVVSMFPKRIRYTACSLAFSLSITIFGGTTPMIATGLIQLSGSLLAPAFLLIAAGLVSVFSIRKQTAQIQ